MEKSKAVAPEKQESAPEVRTPIVMICPITGCRWVHIGQTVHVESDSADDSSLRSQITRAELRGKLTLHLEDHGINTPAGYASGVTRVAVVGDAGDSEDAMCLTGGRQMWSGREVVFVRSDAPPAVFHSSIDQADLVIFVSNTEGDISGWREILDYSLHLVKPVLIHRFSDKHFGPELVQMNAAGEPLVIGSIRL